MFYFQFKWLSPRYTKYIYIFREKEKLSSESSGGMVVKEEFTLYLNFSLNESTNCRYEFGYLDEDEGKIVPLDEADWTKRQKILRYMLT